MPALKPPLQKPTNSKQHYRVTNAWFINPVNCPGFFGTATVLDNTRPQCKNLKMKLTSLDGWLVFNLDGKLAATTGLITVAIEPIENES